MNLFPKISLAGLLIALAVIFAVCPVEAAYKGAKRNKKAGRRVRANDTLESAMMHALAGLPSNLRDDVRRGFAHEMADAGLSHEMAGVTAQLFPDGEQKAPHVDRAVNNPSGSDDSGQVSQDAVEDVIRLFDRAMGAAGEQVFDRLMASPEVVAARLQWGASIADEPKVTPCDSQPNPTSTDLNKSFARAILGKNTMAMESLILQSPGLIYAQFTDPESGHITNPLKFAIDHAEVNLVGSLAARADILLLDRRIFGELPCLYALKRAVQTGDQALYTIAKILLPADEVINDSEWQNLMILAIKGDSQFIKFILGVNPSRALSYKDKRTGDTLTHLAAKCGNSGVLKEIQIADSSRFGVKNKKRQTPKESFEEKWRSFDGKQEPEHVCVTRSWFQAVERKRHSELRVADQAMNDLFEQEKRDQGQKQQQEKEKKKAIQDKNRQRNQQKKAEAAVVLRMQENDVLVKEVALFKQRQKNERSKIEQQERVRVESNGLYMDGIVQKHADDERNSNHEAALRQQSIAQARALKDSELERYKREYAQDSMQARRDEQRARQESMKMAIELAHVARNEQISKKEQMDATRRADYARKRPLVSSSGKNFSVWRPKMELPPLRKHALIDAVTKGEFAIVGQLVEAGVNPHAKKAGRTAYDILQAAVAQGRIDQAECNHYLDSIQRAEQKFVRYKNKLQHAAERGNVGFLGVLYKKFKTNALVNRTKFPLKNNYANLVNVLDDQGRTPLEQAVDAQQLYFAHELIEKFPTALAGKNIRLISKLLDHSKTVEIEEDLSVMDWPVDTFKDKYVALPGAPDLCADLFVPVQGVYIPKGEYSVADLYVQCYGQRLIPCSGEDIETDSSSEGSESE